jgi:hypothetical protein
MNETKQDNRHLRYRGSLVWPIILIALGIIFLLNNLGMMTGDIWDTILRLWPVLLIAIGIDGFLRRGGLVGSTLIIAVGIVFILSNYGYLTVNVWEVVVRLWPLLLIAMGFDVFIGRRSIWASLVGLVLILVILAGALWAFGVGIGSGQTLTGEQVSQPLGNAAQASIKIEPGAASIRLQALKTSDNLLAGTIGTNKGQSVVKDFSQNGNNVSLTLRTTGANFYYLPAGSSQWSWDLGLTPQIPINLTVNLGAGNTDLDLTGLQISSLNVDMGVGNASMILPASGNYNARINGAIGQLVIEIPQGLGVKVKSDAAIASVNLPADFQEQNGFSTSPGYASAGSRVDLNLGMAIGNVTVRYSGSK